MAQYTKKAIQKVFMQFLNESAFDKISIISIAEKSEVSRNTVYYYYEDIYALLEDIFQIEKKKIIDKLGDCCTWQEIFLETTSFSSENRRAVYNLCNCGSIKAHDMLYDFYHSVFSYGIENYVHKEAKGLDVSVEDMKTLVEFNTSALHGIFNKWLMDDMKDDAKTYISGLDRMLKGNVRQTLERVNRSVNEPAI